MTESDIRKATNYCKQEIFFLRAAPRLNGCKMTPEWKEQLECMETCLAALRLAEKQLPNNC